MLEGMPGLGKTMLVRTISEVFQLSFKRIQFTPDLMPSDVTGTNTMVRDERRVALKKARFLQILYLQMRLTVPHQRHSRTVRSHAEHTVTVGNDSHKLEEPFLVLATQNPIENEETIRCRRHSWIVFYLKSW